MSFEEKTAEINHSLKCQGCGAILKYEAGTNNLKCEYCGTTNEIINSNEDTNFSKAIPLNEFNEIINQKINGAFQITAEVVKCNNCGAATTLDPSITAASCPFCASPLVIDHQVQHILKPQAIIPFLVNKKNAYDNFKKWAGGLWFAPNDFKNIHNTNSINALRGVYIPYWSFDAFSATKYNGQRGEYYYVNRTVRDKDGNTSTVSERRTRWYPASGDFTFQFNDVLVSASQSLPQKFVSNLGPWNLQKLIQFNEQYLSGFIAETYQIDHIKSFVTAKQIMDNHIKYLIRQDIGGDEQSIINYNVNLKNEALKYILLPTWLTAYKYKNKSYQLMINAITGKVIGDRPYSFWKIFFAILTGLIIIFGIFATSQN